jgi:isoaspartyl peptidase/L-asparaginase-like protein (Ntn-hydrolase superfamily)
VVGDASAAIMTGKDGHFADIEGLAHVENPLFSIARAGLGILSQGLGR